MNIRKSNGLQFALICALTGFVLLTSSAPAFALWNPFAKPKPTTTRTATVTCSPDSTTFGVGNSIKLTASGATSYDWQIMRPSIRSQVYPAPNTSSLTSSILYWSTSVADGYHVIVKNHDNTTEEGSCDFTVSNTVTSIAPPTFSPTNGTPITSSSLAVNLSTTTSGATIRYTVTSDGSNPPEPTSSSTQYTTPITLSQTSTIRAKAFLGTQTSTSDFATYAKTTSPPSDPLTCSISPTSINSGEQTTVTLTNGTPNYNVYWGLPTDPENIGSATSATKQYTNTTSTDATYTIQADDATSATKVDCGTLTVKGTSNPPPPNNATITLFTAVTPYDSIRPNWDNFKNATTTDQTFSTITPGSTIVFSYTGQAPNDNCKLVSLTPNTDTIITSISTPCNVYRANPQTLTVNQDVDYQLQAVGSTTVTSGKIQVRVAGTSGVIKVKVSFLKDPVPFYPLEMTTELGAKKIVYTDSYGYLRDIHRPQFGGTIILRAHSNNISGELTINNSTKVYPPDTIEMELVGAVACINKMKDIAQDSLNNHVDSDKIKVALKDILVQAEAALQDEANADKTPREILEQMRKQNEGHFRTLLADSKLNISNLKNHIDGYDWKKDFKNQVNDHKEMYNRVKSLTHESHHNIGSQITSLLSFYFSLRDAIHVVQSTDGSYQSKIDAAVTTIDKSYDGTIPSVAINLFDELFKQIVDHADDIYQFTTSQSCGRYIKTLNFVIDGGKYDLDKIDIGNYSFKPTIDFSGKKIDVTSRWENNQVLMTVKVDGYDFAYEHTLGNGKVVLKQGTQNGFEANYSYKTTF